MKCYSYVMDRDFGFAPNPFYGICTLATCKSLIREHSDIGDLVVGCGAAKYNLSGKIIYVMIVETKIDFNEYWNNVLYRCKRPIMNGSLKQMYGDNIYHKNGRWIQEESHHSNLDGSENIINMDRDLRSKYVLLSNKYWYFGRNPIEIPKRFKHEPDSICFKGRNCKKIENETLIRNFIIWLYGKYGPGYYYDPKQFGGKFAKYKG